METAWTDVYRTRPKGDFVLLPYRRSRGPFGALGMPVILIPKDTYVERIVPELLRSLREFSAFAEEHEFDRSPDQPLQKFGVFVELDGDNLTLRRMKRHHGGHVGTGDRFVVPVSEVDSVLPERLLDAMGERPADIARFMKRYGKKG